MLVKYIVYIFVLLLFSGCLDSPNPENMMESIKKENLPSWVYYPNKNVTFGAIGVSSKQKNLKLQRRLALVKARASLSQSIKLNVKTNITSNIKSSSKSYESSVNTSSEQTSNNMIQRAYIKDTFMDKVGNLYIWLVIEP